MLILSDRRQFLQHNLVESSRALEFGGGSGVVVGAVHEPLAGCWFKTFNCVGETLIFVGSRRIFGTVLHLGTSVAHRNAQTTVLEHRHIVGHIANCGNLVGGNLTIFSTLLDQFGH